MKRHIVICGLVAILTAMSITTVLPAERSDMVMSEPNVEVANSWWPALKNVWTPIGWKDHLFRFCVLYNGIVTADPNVGFPTKHREKYAGLGVQLTLTPSADGSFPAPIQEPYQLSDTPDNGVGNQGWADNPAPVLWTEWRCTHMYGNYGVVMRQEVFAHPPGGGDVKTGVDPIYAWIRLSVSHVDELQAPEYFGFMIHLGAVHMGRSMFHENNLTVHPAKSQYPRVLTRAIFDDSSGAACHIMEEDGKVRLVGATATGAIILKEREPGTKDYYLHVNMPAKVGDHVDLLLPMLPGDRKDVDAEAALGFEGALKESNAYWSNLPKTAATVDTPEEQVNEGVRHTVKLAEVISETNPETGECSFLTGAWNYDALWATPTSMTGHMLLDRLGYHSSVAKHLEIFRENQGTVTAPGPSYSLHPGYFSSPKTLTSIDWLTDHGAILYEICNHALQTGDQEFIDRWLDAIVKGCEFIKDVRAIKDHEGVPGVLPPAVATDRNVPTQSVWNIGWNYKGLTAAVKLLQRVGHPRADEFAREADDYKEVFVKAFREHVKEMPRWTDGQGRSRPIVPISLSAGSEIMHPFYLDGGPLQIVWSGLMDADDELMRTCAAFFREGPNTKIYDPRGNMHQRPVLVHEISSCEPCYSWNTYHSWQLGDRYRFLEGMYSLLTGAMSSQTYSGCEHRHGIYGIVAANAMFVDLMRLSVIDDVIRQDELHLLRLVPLAWVRADYETKFENMPTEFGPVTLEFRLSDDEKALLVTFEPKFRLKPTKVALHVPPVQGLTKVIVNGREYKAKPGDALTIR